MSAVLGCTEPRISSSRASAGPVDRPIPGNRLTPLVPSPLWTPTETASPMVMTGPRPSAGCWASVEATPLSFHVGHRSWADAPTRRRGGHRSRSWHRRSAVTLSGVVSQVTAVHEGASFGSDVFLIADGVLPAEAFESAEVLVTRVDPEIYVPPAPGGLGPPGRRCRARYGAVVRPHGTPVGHRRRSRRSAAVRQPRLPRRHARRPRQHLGYLRGRDQDHLRHVPAPLAVLGRGARSRGGEHQGADLQRQGRGPAVPRPTERPAHRRSASRLRPARAPGGAVRVVRVSSPRPATATRSPSPTSPSRSTRRARRSTGRCRSSAPRSCCRSSSPTPRTSASSTR